MPIFRRCAVVLAAGAAVLAALAGSAAAHVEVEAQPARALATGAVITMTAEAESTTAGIAGVRIQLPAGLVPADFTLAAGPAGWRASGAQQVLQVRGPALPVGRDLRLSLRVRQLPAARRVVLKTIQSYGDGRQDSWIEVPEAGAPEPDSPAPVLQLAAAAAGATPLPRETPGTPGPTTAAPATAVPTSAAPTVSPAAAENDGGGSNAIWVFVGAGVGALLLGGFVLAARRAGPRSGPPAGG
jgi:uncharacterized protein YcnI